MNKILKYFMILLTFALIAVPAIFAYQLFKSSESAFQTSYSKMMHNANLTYVKEKLTHLKMQFQFYS